MSRTKVVVGLAFALALCAGVAVGLVSAKLPDQHRKPKPGEPRSWLADELNLSPAQREPMKAIWQDVARGRPGGPSTAPGGPPGPNRGDERRRFERERNEAILAAVTDPEQRRRVEEVMQQFEQKQLEAARERERMFEEAVEKTKAILDENQRKKYEQILLKRKNERDARNESRNNASSTFPATGPSAAVRQ